MPISRAFGPFTVVALEDGQGPHMTRAEAFPSATAEQWAAADAVDPAALRDGDWWLSFRSFAVRRGDGPVTLVDAGFGPAGALASDWTPVPGHLPEELAAAGIAPGDVEAIVLTHLHDDHMGWAPPADSPFTAARVIAQRADVDHYTKNRDKAGQYDRLIAPLRDEGRLQVVEGDVRLGPGLRIRSTPGHTPGHQSVLVEDGDDRLLITGDLVVHTIQILHPEIAYAGDGDFDLARVSRREALAGVTTVAASHVGVPFMEKAGPQPAARP